MGVESVDQVASGEHVDDHVHILGLSGEEGLGSLLSHCLARMLKSTTLKSAKANTRCPALGIATLAPGFEGPDVLTSIAHCTAPNWPASMNTS